MATIVTAAHHSIERHLYDSMHAAQKPKSELKFVTLDKESNMSTMWRREEFLRICSKKDLTEKAQDIEVTIPVKKSQEARYNPDPGSFFVNRFWGRRPDGVAINEALKIGYIVEFKRSTDRDEGFLEVKDAEANQQHKSIIGALKAAAPEFWSKGPWLGEELEKAWENYYEVQGYLPFATCGYDQYRSKDLCMLTSAALPSTSPSSPLHAPFTPCTPGSQVPGVDSPCSTAPGVKWRLPKQARHGPVCLQRLLSRTDES